MSETAIDTEEAFLTSLRRSMQRELTEALEPAIKEAIAKIEKDMRERLGSLVIRTLDMNYSVVQDSRELRITVRKEPR